MGSFASQLGQQVATGAATTAANGLLGTAFGLIGARQQYKYNKKLMAQQQQYARENFQMENDRQDYLLLHQAAMEKEGLKNAGYSTADPEGVGVSPVGAASIDSPSNGSVSWNPPSFDIAGSAYTMSQARLANSQSDLNEIEAKYRAQLLEGTIGKLNIEIDTMKQELPLKIDTMKQQLANIGQEFDLKDFQIKAAAQEVDRIGALVEGLRIDNRWKEDMNKWQVDKLKNECYILAREGKVKDLEAKLAEFGILANADGLTNLFGILAVDGSGKIMSAISSNLKSLFEGLPDLIFDCFSAMFDGIAQAPSTLWKRFKEKFPAFKSLSEEVDKAKN